MNVNDIIAKGSMPKLAEKGKAQVKEISLKPNFGDVAANNPNNGQIVINLDGRMSTRHVRSGVFPAPNVGSLPTTSGSPTTWRRLSRMARPTSVTR